MGSLGSMATPRWLSEVASAFPGRSLEVLTEQRPGAHATASTQMSPVTRGPQPPKQLAALGKHPAPFTYLKSFQE